MTYVNLVFHKGYERFAAEAVESNISGIILPDLPLEEMGEWEPAADAAGRETVMLASPLTPDDRLAALCERSKVFTSEDDKYELQPPIRLAHALHCLKKK